MWAIATFSIRIVADFGVNYFQFMMKFKRATTLEFTTVWLLFLYSVVCC